MLCLLCDVLTRLTLVAEAIFFLCERGKNKEVLLFQLYVETCLKKDGNSYKTAFNFSE